MPRREHTSSESYIDWLKSLGCVFYAPLGQGDLTDHIGGTTGAPYTNTYSQNLQWNSSVGAYRFYSYRSPNNCCRFPLYNFRERMGSGNNYMWMIDVRKITQTVFVFIIGYVNSTAGPNYPYGIDMNNVYGVYNFPTNEFVNVYVVDNYDDATTYWYINGNVVAYSNMDATYYSHRPNWRDSYYNYLTVGGSFGSWVCDNYFKNAMLFNRALSQQEIMEIQGI